MKKYAVAICNLMTGINEVKIVEAENEINAIVLANEGVLELTSEFSTVADVIRYYYDGDLSVSNPVELM